MKSIWIGIAILINLLAVLASNSVHDWTDDNLELLNDSQEGINRLILVYAEWCGACRRFKPKFHQNIPKLVQLSPSPLEIIQINLDKAPLIGSRLRISHLPSLYHQIGGEFRKLDAFKDNLEKCFEKKLWIGTPTMGSLSPPRSRKAAAGDSKKFSKFTISGFIDDLGVSVPVFILLTSTFLLLIAFFIIWCIWLYTDYKLNAHNFTEEAIKERIKYLRKHPDYREEFGGSEFDSKEDSGNESDTETESERESVQNSSESKLLRGRRSSIKNRLK